MSAFSRGAGNTDYIRAAAAVTPAVVHLKTLYARQDSIFLNLSKVPFFITQEMLFENSELVLNPDENIDTIFFENRTFIHADQGLLEKLSHSAVALYVQ